MQKASHCTSRLGLSAGLILTLAAVGTALADDAATPQSAFTQFATRDYLLGDWGGYRSDLSKHGVDFEFFYGGSYADNMSGGNRTGSLYQGGLLMDMTLDSKKLIGYEGGTFNISALELHGQKPFSTFNNGAPAYVGDLNKVNLLDFPNGARLWELWYQQKFIDNKLSIKFGKLSIDRDFIVPDLYSQLGNFALINQTWLFPTLMFDVFDIPGLPRQYNGLGATPNATPGVVVRVEPTSNIYAQTSVYGGNPDVNPPGLEFNLHQANGLLMYSELGYRFNLGPKDTGLKGSYKLGGFYDTGNFNDVNQGVNSAVNTPINAALGGFGVNLPTAVNVHSGNMGYYFHAEQQLYAAKGNRDDAKDGLISFFRVGGAPADRNLAEFEIDGGLVYKGLIPTRDWDTLAFGFSHLKMSHEIASAEQNANATIAGINTAFGLTQAPAFAAIADYEEVLELSYKFQMTAWWTVQPDLQRVFHPGGSAALPNATVFILQTTLRL